MVKMGPIKIGGHFLLSFSFSTHDTVTLSLPQNKSVWAPCFFDSPYSTKIGLIVENEVSITVGTRNGIIDKQGKRPSLGWTRENKEKGSVMPQLLSFQVNRTVVTHGHLEESMWTVWTCVPLIRYPPFSVGVYWQSSGFIFKEGSCGLENTAMRLQWQATWYIYCRCQVNNVYITQTLRD